MCDLKLWLKFPQIQELAFINGDVGCQVMVAAVKSFLGVFWACWGLGGPLVSTMSPPPPEISPQLENSCWKTQYFDSRGGFSQDF